MRGWVVCVVLCATSVARADDPWDEGVKADAKADADALREEGDALFAKGRFQDALDLYAEAVKAWDHPAFRLQMARAYLALEQPADATVQLELALRWGDRPFTPSEYVEAQNYQRLLARKPEAPDADADVDEPEPEPDELVTVEAPGRRWPAWAPWAVGGGGLGVVLLGVLLDVKASNDMDAFHRSLAVQCPDDCFAETIDRSAADMAITENRIAIGLIVVGAVAVAAGAAGVVLDRMHPYATETSAGVEVAGRF